MGITISKEKVARLENFEDKTGDKQNEFLVEAGLKVQKKR
jgi:hypothetical protein